MYFVKTASFWGFSSFLFLCDNTQQQQVINIHSPKLPTQLERDYRTLLFISVDAHVVIAIVIVLDVDDLNSNQMVFVRKRKQSVITPL